MSSMQDEAERPRLSSPRPPAERRGIHEFVWDAWPWMNWLLPIFFCFHGWLGNGGWETLFLTFSSPVIVPVFGLLASLPRFILRKRGHVTVPGGMIWLLFLNWWSWFVAPLTIAGATDGAPFLSLLQSAIIVPLSDGYQGGLMVASAIMGVLSWVILLVLAGTQRSLPATGRWSVISWISAFVIPLLFALVVFIGTQTTADHLDAAAETSASVSARPIQEQAERAQERYEQTQQAVSEVRSLIAADDWEMLGGLTGSPHECRLLQMECYVVDVEFSHETAGIGRDRAELMRQIESLGWTSSADGEFTDFEGRELRLAITEHGVVLLEVESPWWWGDADEIQRRLEEGGDRPGSYAADEWPRL